LLKHDNFISLAAASVHDVACLVSKDHFPITAARLVHMLPQTTESKTIL